jgi:DNA-binding NarL/FixJ family response regulator
VPEAAPVRVLVVDDQLPFRVAARILVGLTDGFELVGEAASGEEAIALVAAVSPDLVLMDVNLPGIDGLETTRRLTDADDPPVVVLCSTYQHDDLPSNASECGAVGYVHKEQLAPEVLGRAWHERRC